MVVCQCTTVHKREDLRVFYKTSVSLAKAGYKVYLVVADGKGDEVKNGVEIIDLGNYYRNRKKRLTEAKKMMFLKIADIKPDFAQFHDPELLPVAVKLKSLGIKVIFDSHEDVPKQIFYKEWLGPLFMRRIFSNLYNKWEKAKVAKLDALISVIDEITNKFKCRHTVTIKNYPIIEVFQNGAVAWEDREDIITYVGTFSEKRGIYDYIETMQYVDNAYQLHLIGKFESADFEAKCKSSKGWAKVVFHGFRPMEEVAKIIGNSKIGLSVLHAEQNYLTSLPTKGFEYMAAQTPMIMSDFEYWRPYFNQTAAFIKPNNPEILGRKINELIRVPSQLQAMHESCKERYATYSWEEESKKLIKLYKDLA